MKEGNEACDDGNSTSNDGCSATCTIDETPSFSVSLDKSSVMTELNTTSMFTITVRGAGGFSGPVSLAASIVDGTGAPVPGWTVALNKQSVNAVDGGTVDAIAQVVVPSENRALAGTLKIDATSTTLGAKASTATLTALNQISLTVTDTGNGTCAYPMGTTRVTVGTKIRLVNKLTAAVIFHSDGAGAGLPHQDVGGTGTAPNQAYEGTITQANAAFNWYCHSPGPNPGNAVRFQTVAVQP